MKWRPIAGFHKGDQEHVLLLVDGNAIEGWQYQGAWYKISLESHGCGCCGCNDSDPTHWAPLPTLELKENEL